ncbi:MAG: methionine--tRNA ligase [Candidatus Eisenbacteria bacterium]|nr:methionine--tRNA ligase [Candidatus Eisenbacteria bacterium]
MPKFYLTTAIDYVNSLPHVGTAYEKITADVIARYKRLSGFDTFLLMGNDEHSYNVRKEALGKGLEPAEYCDMMAEKFRERWASLEISFDDFIRTTEPRHADAVKDLFTKINGNGDIYKGKYEGYYCVSCEAYLKEKDLADGNCPVHGTRAEWLSEENYFFALSKYAGKLEKHIDENPDFVLPEIRRNEILNVIKGGLEDVSISRSSLGWGVPAPVDAAQTIYVWFDALINYLSGIGYPGTSTLFDRYWPCDLHIVGKDITRFHCVVWPAMLLSAGIPLPKSIFGHGFVSFKGEKMSKTLGHVVDPLDVVAKYGADSLRYYLLREVPFGKDGDFSWELFIERYNSDLANNIGNLVTRTLGMLERYSNAEVPRSQKRNALDDEVISVSSQTIAEYRQFMDGYELHQGVQSALKLSRRANQYIEESQPWVLAKGGDKERLGTVLAVLSEAIRILAGLLCPFLPSKSKEIETLFSIDQVEKAPLKNLAWDENRSRGKKVKPPSPLFPRIEEK